VDQHADNHGAIRLNLHAVVLVGEQVFAAEHLLERAEEHLDQPPPPIHLRDGFRRQVEHDAAMLTTRNSPWLAQIAKASASVPERPDWMLGRRPTQFTRLAKRFRSFCE
jgi:hypothetical protein